MKRIEGNLEIKKEWNTDDWIKQIYTDKK